METDMTRAQDAELREQIVGSCRVINRHIEGIVADAKAITELPNYRTECEDALNEAHRIIRLANQAIALAKKEMGKKQLEKVPA